MTIYAIWDLTLDIILDGSGSYVTNSNYRFYSNGASACALGSDTSLAAAKSSPSQTLTLGGGASSTMRLFYYEFGSLAIYIPASHLISINQHNIIGMDLFFDNIPTNGTGSVIIYMAEDGDRVVNPSSMIEVVEIGSGVFLSDKTLHIDFDRPYYYTNDNLTILFDWSNDNKYSTNAYMYGHIRLYIAEHDSGSSGGGGSSTTDYYYYSFDVDEGSNGNTRSEWDDGYEYIFAAITPNSEFSNLGEARTIGRFFGISNETRIVDDYGEVCLYENDFANRFVTIYQGSDVYTNAPYDIDTSELAIEINDNPVGSIVFGPDFDQTQYLGSYTWFLLNTMDDTLYNAIEHLSSSGNVEVLRPNSSNVYPVNILINSNGYMPIVKYFSDGLSYRIYWVHIDKLRYGETYFNDDEFISLSPIYLLSQPIGTGPGSLRGGDGDYYSLLALFKDNIDQETGERLDEDEYEEPIDASYSEISVNNPHSNNSTSMTVFTPNDNTILTGGQDLTGQVPEDLRAGIEWFSENYSSLGDYQGVIILASLNSPLIFETGYIYILPHSGSFDYEAFLNNGYNLIEFFEMGYTDILFEGDTVAKEYFFQLLSNSELIAYGNFGGATWTMTFEEQNFDIPVEI